MGVQAFGTDQFLKYTIRNRLEHIKKDDQVRRCIFNQVVVTLTSPTSQLIQAEGIDSLSTSELQAACQSRGVRTLGVSPSRLRENLNQWITLHITNDISGVLLILSRAFDWGENAGTESVIQSLGSVLASLPDNLVKRLLVLLAPNT